MFSRDNRTNMILKLAWHPILIHWLVWNIDFTLIFAVLTVRSRLRALREHFSPSKIFMRYFNLSFECLLCKLNGKYRHCVEAKDEADNDRHSIEAATAELKAISLRRTTMMAPNEIESHSETTLCKHTQFQMDEKTWSEYTWEKCKSVSSGWTLTTHIPLSRVQLNSVCMRHYYVHFAYIF